MAMKLEERKLTMGVSVPADIYLLKQEKGNRWMLDIITLGLWAHQNQICRTTLAKLQWKYEEKILNVVKRLEEGYQSK